MSMFAFANYSQFPEPAILSFPSESFLVLFVSFPSLCLVWKIVLSKEGHTSIHPISLGLRSLGHFSEVMLCDFQVWVIKRIQLSPYFFFFF